MKNKKLGFEAKFIIFTGVFLLAANMLLGAVLLLQQRNSMRNMLNEQMLELANTAASMLDGDVLGSVTEESADSPEIKEIVGALNKFKQHNNIVYIYVVRTDENNGNRFYFTVDPDPDDPAAFGEEIVYTDALYSASKGTPAIDRDASEDRWGGFYSAFSPVYDSKGGIGGIVGVDFEAEWYDRQIAGHMVSVLIISGASLLAGCMIVLLIAAHYRRKFRAFSSELSLLSNEVESLTDEIAASPGYEESLRKAKEKEAGSGVPAEEMPEIPEGRKDAIEDLGSKLRKIRTELLDYITYVHAQAYVDTLTGVSSRAAYFDLLETLTEKINNRCADFSIAVFDVNRLKETNDRFGHEFGDALLVDSATVLKSVFGEDHVFRIGGDEFIVILEGVSIDEMHALLEMFDTELTEFNKSLEGSEAEISVSGGAAAFDSRIDADFTHVFKRADDEMYRRKAEYYKRSGDRRRPNAGN